MHVKAPGMYLLAQEITDLDGFSTVLYDAVNGEVSVNSTHFVLEALSVHVK
jgi:hypothetical protein